MEATLLNRVLALLSAAVLTVTFAPPAAAATVPAAPALQVAPRNGAVLARWTAPPASGAAVTKYQVAHRKYKPTSKKWTAWTFTDVLQTSRSRTIVATNGTLVQVRVRAYNRLGAGARSSWVSQRAGVPRGEPVHLRVDVGRDPGDDRPDRSWLRREGSD